MKASHFNPAQEQRAETFTVDVGTVKGTKIEITFEIGAAVCTGPHGVGGAVSVRPLQVHLADDEGVRVITLR